MPQRQETAGNVSPKRESGADGKTEPKKDHFEQQQQTADPKGKKAKKPEEADVNEARPVCGRCGKHHSSRKCNRCFYCHRGHRFNNSSCRQKERKSYGSWLSGSNLVWGGS